MTNGEFFGTHFNPEPRPIDIIHEFMKNLLDKNFITKEEYSKYWCLFLEGYIGLRELLREKGLLNNE